MPRLAAFPAGFSRDLVEGRMTLLKWIALAGQIEVDGIEVDPRFLESFESAYLRRVRQEAAARSLKVAMVAHASDFSLPDPAARAEEVRKARKILQVTAELGGRCCRVLGGQGLGAGPGLAGAVDCVLELLPYAESTSVVMVVENPPAEGILEGVKSPWFKVQYDPSKAAAAGEDPYGLLERVLPRLAAVRVADRCLEGPVDGDRIFSRMAGAGFDGWVVLEGGAAKTVELGLEGFRQGVRLLRARFARHFPKA